MYVLVRETKEIDGRIRRMFFSETNWGLCMMTRNISDARKYRTKKEAITEMRSLIKGFTVGKVEDYVQAV